MLKLQTLKKHHAKKILWKSFISKVADLLNLIVRDVSVHLAFAFYLAEIFLSNTKQIIQFVCREKATLKTTLN